MMPIENKVALISCAARGMGAAEAKLFAREEAKVVIGDVLEEDGRRTGAEISEARARPPHVFRWGGPLNPKRWLMQRCTWCPTSRLS